jgi:hypothetical protein
MGFRAIVRKHRTRGGGAGAVRRRPDFETGGAIGFGLELRGFLRGEEMRIQKVMTNQ